MITRPASSFEAKQKPTTGSSVEVSRVCFERTAGVWKMLSDGERKSMLCLYDGGENSLIITCFWQADVLSQVITVSLVFALRDGWRFDDRDREPTPDPERTVSPLIAS